MMATTAATSGGIGSGSNVKQVLEEIQAPFEPNC